MAQAVYAATCHAFPDSYRQFGETFKNDLVSIVMEWMTGWYPCGFPLSLSEWSFAICSTPYNRKYNVLSVLLNKTFPSFHLYLYCIGHLLMSSSFDVSLVKLLFQLR